MSHTTTTASIDLNKILTGSHLPALPQSAVQIMDLARNPNNGPAEFATTIEADPGLTGQVLRFVNSSYFGFSNEISSVKLAITLVGVRTIKNFALWSAVFSLMPNPRCGPFELKSLWQDSLRRALFARLVARLKGHKDAEEAFAAALLQDMAVPLLAKQFPVDYVELLKQRQDGRRLSELETERFGWNHAQAGALMARAWRLPEEFGLLIENHAQPSESAGDARMSLFQALVSLSALLPASVDSGWPEAAQFEKAYQSLGVPGGLTLLDVLERTDEEFTDFAPLLRITTPSKSLADFYKEALASTS